MHYITSMARISWAKSILTHFFLFDSNLTGFFFFCSIVVEFAKESRPRRDPYEERYGYFFQSSTGLYQ
jgi:hypothetical protein